ncbi:hypothetical protein RvY_04508 [Ramazzottius varieornatus]|uniref:Uncharacterized protein n=1 Tax=Ramazzottius varieornatus TaxID=947166 RepID=A0A1D1URU7_RAMVA|nr:hypothetical protein RvY_04508 [Ramazzottius varieornatus]
MEDMKKVEEAERRAMVQQFGVIVRGGQSAAAQEGKENASGRAGDSKAVHPRTVTNSGSLEQDGLQDKYARTLRKALRKMGVPLIVSDETFSLVEEDIAVAHPAENRAFLLSLPDKFTKDVSENLIKQALAELNKTAKSVLLSSDGSLKNSSSDFFELVQFLRELLQRNFTLEYRDVASVEERQRRKEEANEAPTFSAQNLLNENNDTPVPYGVDPFHPLTSRQIWMEISLAKVDYPSTLTSNEIHDAAWKRWSSLQTAVEINPKFGLCLRLDNTLSSNTKITQRWFAERLRALVIPSHIWKSNKTGYPVLPPLTKDFLIRSFHHPHITYLLETPSTSLSAVDEERLHSCFLYLLHLFKEYYRTVRDAPRQRLMRHLADVPIRPLQPLRDHLTQEIYEVFEADPIKYRLYNSAMFQALKDWRKKAENRSGSGSGNRHLDVTGQDAVNSRADDPVVVAMVVGAGRGPLVSEFISAAVALDVKFKVYALDKNPIAIGAMLAKLEDEWIPHADSIHIVQSDMRDFEPGDKADMIISELLGSFGCNELSPECLDGAQRLLKPGGISIPHAYSNFLQPVMARSLHDDMVTYAPKHKEMLNEFILVEMRSSVEIAPYQEAFKFVHPNYEAHSNERDVTLRFTADIDYVMTGFAGYFDLHLYKDVSMNILPDKQTVGLSSWFPACFALERPVAVAKDQEIVLHMGRRCDVAGKRVWYVWNLLEPEVLPIQNALPDNWISM